MKSTAKPQRHKMRLRVVFDTNILISAFVFKRGNLLWLRAHLEIAKVQPLVSRPTASELIRVFQYPKFKLSQEERAEVLADYLAVCEFVDVGQSFPIKCRDVTDQKYLNLAFAGKADVLVSGDKDLLELNGQCPFVIETPADYGKRFS